MHPLLVDRSAAGSSVCVVFTAVSEACKHYCQQACEAVRCVTFKRPPMMHVHVCCTRLHLVLVDHLPTPPSIRVGGHSLKYHIGGATQQGAVCQVGVACDPALATISLCAARSFSARTLHKAVMSASSPVLVRNVGTDGGCEQQAAPEHGHSMRIVQACQGQALSHVCCRCLAWMWDGA